MYFKKEINKKGWIRITEAVVAILIMASVLIVIYTNQTPQVNISNYVYDLQIKLLNGVADRADLRNAVISGDISFMKTNYFDLGIPKNFDYNITICKIGDPCNSAPNVNTAVYVEDRIISSNLQKYEPKMLRLYIWEKQV